MRIGQLEKKTNIPVETLRFWERQGLIMPARSGPGQYRNYSEGDIRRIRFILHAKAVGFTLSEISQLLQMQHAQANRSADDILRFAQNKLHVIRAKVTEMQLMRDKLSDLIDECISSSDNNKACSVIDKLDDNSG